MRDRLDELGHNTDVVLITFTDPENIPAYLAGNDLPFPVLVDAVRKAYHAFGLGRGTLRRVYGWKAARRYFEIFRSNGIRDLRKPTEDTFQLGGDFIVSSDGTLAWGFWGEGPDDRPDVDEMISAIRRIGS